jgi:hypothetical protein
MDHLRRLGNNISIPIPADDDGFTGRECPQQDCEGYFKIEFGTGLKGEGFPCHCPYCGHTDGHDHFWTKEQVEYARSVAMRKITAALYKDLKKLEFEHKPKGAFGIGISMKVKPGQPVPIHSYREKQLETEVVCDNCTLRYSVYGVFAFCPDCGQHNSLQILDKNLEVVGKVLDLAAGSPKELADRLIENALEDCVSALDGFGREVCRVHAKTSIDPAKAVNVSFQNLEGARQHMNGLFKVDLTTALTDEEWKAAAQAFQKRHLLSHTMGVMDDEYVRRSGDPYAVVGRKVSIDAGEVRQLAQIIGKLGRYLSETMGIIRS